jgi:hypothetical protein
LVYENLSVTIEVFTTSSSFEGIPRFKRARRDVAQFNAVIGEAKVVFKSQRDWASEIFYGSWTTRGWVFQEALLSRRYLVFSDFKFVFHCCENTGLKYIASQPAFLNDKFNDAVRYLPTNSQRVRPYSWNFRFIATGWDFELYRDLLENYSQPILSYQQDFVNGFRVIGGKFEPNTGQSFVFGLP